MSSARTYSWNEVRARRLAHNHLFHRGPQQPLVDVVREVCGIQAQIMGAAELAISARCAELNHFDVRRALWETRSLVKTYGPRGTLHLLPATELPMWMAAMQAVPNPKGTMSREVPDLNVEQVDALVGATRDALDGGRLTREQLAREVSARVGEWAQARLMSTWGELLSPLALSGSLCFGPSEGSRVTFVRADQWIGGWREEDPWASLLQVVRRFLSAYGPTRPREFASWFGTQPSAAAAAFDELGDEVVEVDIEGDRAWLMSDDLVENIHPAADVVNLVPQYDCFVRGSRPREQLMSDEAHRRIRSYGRGIYEGAVGLSTLLIDGQVSGIWNRRLLARHIEITVEPLVDLTTSRRERLEVEVARVGAFFHREASFRIGALA